jgi:hypothetical protein
METKFKKGDVVIITNDSTGTWYKRGMIFRIEQDNSIFPFIQGKPNNRLIDQEHAELLSSIPKEKIWVRCGVWDDYINIETKEIHFILQDDAFLISDEDYKKYFDEKKPKVSENIKKLIDFVENYKRFNPGGVSKDEQKFTAKFDSPIITIEKKYSDYIALDFKRCDLDDTVEFNNIGYFGYVLSRELNNQALIQVGSDDLSKPKLFIETPDGMGSIDITFEQVKILLTK